MVTAGWLSSAVEKTCAALVGIVVFFDQLGHHAAQGLDAQRQRGHVEQQHVLDVALQHAWPWMAAPTATASSGLTSLRGSLPKNSLTFSCTLGMRVMPPTRITSSMSPLDAGVLDGRAAGLDGALDQVFDQASSLARVSLMFRCFGPEASAVM
jgi:hypothetical protein